METTTAYLSYPKVHETVANTIIGDLERANVHIISNPDYDDLKNYLTQNPKTICIMLISENYLRSLSCMSQAVAFMQAGDYASMISVILDSQRLKAGSETEYEAYPTRIMYNNDSIRHRDYWWDELIRLRKASNQVQGAEQLIFEHQKKLVKKISTRMSLFLNKVKTYAPLNWNQFQADGYQVLFEKLGLGHTEMEERFALEQNPAVEEKETKPEESTVMVVANSVPLERPVDTELDKGTEKNSDTAEEIYETIAKETTVEEEETKFETATESTTIPTVKTPIVKKQHERDIESTSAALENLESTAERDLVEHLDLLKADDLDFLFRLAESKMEAEAFDTSRLVYEKILEIDPFNGRAFAGLARLLNQHFEKEPHNAELYYRKAIAFNKPNEQLNYEYGLLVKNQLQSIHKAAELFRSVLEINPRFEPAYFELAVCQAQLGMEDAAKANYLQACALNKVFQTAENDERFSVIRQLSNKGKDVDPRRFNKNTVVMVTEATSEIGRSLVERLAVEGYRIIMTGSRENSLTDFKRDIEERFEDVQIQSITLDVRDGANARAAFDSLPEDWKNVDILINNASLVKGLAPFYEGEIADWEQMIDTNIKGLLYMSRMISPIMVERKKGHIVNVGSVVATRPGSVYCATKAAVVALTKTMRLDLYEHNIRVSSVSPENVEIKFASTRSIDKEQAKIYENRQLLKAEDVADAVHYTISRPSHVNVQDLLLSKTQQASVHSISSNEKQVEQEIKQ